LPRIDRLRQSGDTFSSAVSDRILTNPCHFAGLAAIRGDPWQDSYPEIRGDPRQDSNPEIRGVPWQKTILRSAAIRGKTAIPEIRGVPWQKTILRSAMIRGKKEIPRSAAIRG